MKVHGNAALGPAGRLALVRSDRVGDDVEGGSCRPQRRAGDGPPLVASLAGGERGGARARQLASGPLLAAPSPAAATLAPPRRSRSCGPGGRPTSAPAAWRGSAAGLARRSGRCSTATGSRGAARAPGRPTAAMSGRGPERCFTSTSPAWRALSAPGTRSPAIRDRTGAEKRAGVRLRLPALRGRRPLPLRLRRAAPRPGRRDRRRGAGAGDRALRRARRDGRRRR